MLKALSLNSFLSLTAAVFCLAVTCGAAQADPYQLGVEQQQFIESGGNNYGSPYGYPAPQMMQGSAATSAPPRTPKLSAGASQQQQRSAPPIQASIQKQVVLPKGFMGPWVVQGQRTNIEAQPQYQNGVGQLFAPTTRNVWNIGGNPQSGYTLKTDQGVTTSLNIYKVAGNQAFIRYQHPISKTMAQEAVVLELQNGGMSFQGLERISIVKEGEPQPRAKVTYQLYGQRQ